MKAYFTRHNNSLLPADKHSQEVLEKMKYNTWYRVTFTKPRNIQFHKKYWELLNTVIDCSGYYTGIPNETAREDLHKRIKRALKFYDIVAIDNTDFVAIEYKTIRFDKMDNLQFEDYYSSAIDAILKDEELGVSDLERVLEFG